MSTIMLAWAVRKITGPGGSQMTMLLVLVYTNPNCTAVALKERASRYQLGIIPSYSERLLILYE
jgi:hypothetical protein